MSGQEGSRGQKGPAALTPLASLEFISRNFDNPALEWRRLFAEILGDFLLLLVAAGAGGVGAGTAPGLMVLAVILFMGAISGAHLNPAVRLPFAGPRGFPWAARP